MKKNLTTTKSTDLVLNKSKSMLDITGRILSSESALSTEVDESWMERLWAWADENGISDLEWVEDKSYDNGGYYSGLPRDKKTLLESTELNLEDNQLTELPKEIGNLSNLRILGLRGNQLKKLPKEIGNLSNLTGLGLRKIQLTELPKEIGSLSNLTG